MSQRGWSSAPPALGSWRAGQRVRASNITASGGVVEWVCVENGAPGKWAALRKHLIAEGGTEAKPRVRVKAVRAFAEEHAIHTEER